MIVILTFLVFRVIRESPYHSSAARLDYVGSTALGLSLAALVLALSEGSSWGWTSAPVLGMIVGGSVSIVALVFYERRVHGADPRRGSA